MRPLSIIKGCFNAIVPPQPKAKTLEPVVYLQFGFKENIVSDFNVNDFIVCDDEKVMVCIPRGPFRAKRKVPDNNKKKKYNYIVFISDRWWLVHPEFAEGGLVEKLQKACLIEAVDQYGRYLMIPVTYPFEGGGNTWFESWKSVISTAVDKWVSVTSDKQEKIWVPKIVKDKSEPEWPYYSYGEWLERAFHGRVIASLAQLAYAKSLSKKREIESITEEEM